MNLLREIAHRSNDLSLTVGSVDVTRGMFPFIHHIQVAVKGPDGLELFGKGMSENESIAYKKAVGEAIERLCFRCDGRFENSNGIALHTDLATAEESAKRELLERDAYLCHFYTRTPFYRYGMPELNSSIYSDVAEILKKHAIDLYVARLSSCEGLCISVAICIDNSVSRRKGLKIGLGCDKDISQSINSSIFEAISFIPRIVDGIPIPVIGKAEFIGRDKFSVTDFAALAWSDWAVDELKPLMHLQAKYQPTDFDPKVEFIPLCRPTSLEDLNIHVIKAKSADCQELFFRSKVYDHLNFNRLNDFAGKHLDRSFIPSSPHFLA